MFIVLSGFATTDLSVRFRDACQGGGAYGKTAAARPSSVLYCYPCCRLMSLLRELLPLAAAERQEHSD
ncbi:hypothetical protein [Klebsiella pneumoniae]|uniref:hypothetical protein n=1 Tax=Klebsiella pneumoniae TaxID=573 RepID=UPI003857DB72